MTKKKTLSILETIKKKMHKFDNKDNNAKPLEEEEFTYITSLDHSKKPVEEEAKNYDQVEDEKLNAPLEKGQEGDKKEEISQSGANKQEPDISIEKEVKPEEQKAKVPQNFAEINSIINEQKIEGTPNQDLADAHNQLFGDDEDVIFNAPAPEQNIVPENNNPAPSNNNLSEENHNAKPVAPDNSVKENDFYKNPVAEETTNNFNSVDDFLDPNAHPQISSDPMADQENNNLENDEEYHQENPVNISENLKNLEQDFSDFSHNDESTQQQETENMEQATNITSEENTIIKEDNLANEQNITAPLNNVDDITTEQELNNIPAAEIPNEEKNIPAQDFAEDNNVQEHNLTPNHAVSEELYHNNDYTTDFDLENNNLNQEEVPDQNPLDYNPDPIADENLTNETALQEQKEEISSPESNDPVPVDNFDFSDIDGEDSLTSYELPHLENEEREALEKLQNNQADAPVQMEDIAAESPFLEEKTETPIVENNIAENPVFDDHHDEIESEFNKDMMGYNSSHRDHVAHRAIDSSNLSSASSQEIAKIVESQLSNLLAGDLSKIIEETVRREVEKLANKE